MISKNKMSKKTRKELNKTKRVTWEFCPVSRVKPSKKVYERRRYRNEQKADD